MFERLRMNGNATHMCSFHERLWLCQTNYETVQQTLYWQTYMLLVGPLLAVARCKAFCEIPLLASISWQEPSDDAKEITQKI